MREKELQIILEKHKKWLNNERGGERANLREAILNDAKTNESTAFFAMACPEAGAFIGYKKASNYIIKLQITENAKRSSATTRKCRCSEAKVLSITNLDGSETSIKSVASNYNKNFVYTVGEIVKEPDFNENRWVECSKGIHFFITRGEAVNYTD